MCPMGLIPKIFLYNEEEVPPEMRAQRTLNRNRIPEISDYLLSNIDSYILSALTASVDASVEFIANEATGDLGTLKIPMDAKIIINDGQHRRAAIEEAIKQSDDLSKENIPVLFFIDKGLKSSQQMFTDLNKFAIRPSRSLSTLYDHRDPGADLARYLAANCIAFKGLVEMEKSNISNRSTKLFTLSSIKNASKALLQKSTKGNISSDEKSLANRYWEIVGENIADWIKARAKLVSTAELRRDYIHAHGITLQALGIVGATLIEKHPSSWDKKLKNLKKIDWSRSNTTIWEGVALNKGKMSKTNFNINLTAEYILSVMEIK